MDARLFYMDDKVPARGLDELTDVRLVADVEVDPASVLPRGARGTIVAVHGRGEAYDVEFADPFHALLLLRSEEIEAVPGAARDQLIAATGDVRD